MAFGHIEDGNMLIHLLQLEKKVTEQFLRKFCLNPQSGDFELKIDLNRSKLTLGKKNKK